MTEGGLRRPLYFLVYDDEKLYVRFSA